MWLTWCRFSCNAFSNYSFTPSLLVTFRAHHPWVPDSCAGLLTQTCGWRLSSWLTVSVFTSPSDSSCSGPITPGFLTHVRGSWLMCGVPDSNLWLATFVVTHRFSFHLPLVIPLFQAPSPLGSWLMCEVPDSCAGFLTHVRGSWLKPTYINRFFITSYHRYRC